MSAIYAAIQATSDIFPCFHTNSLKTLGQYRKKVNLSKPCQGSVDIDLRLSSKYPNSNRWDYVIGYGDCAYFLEVHSAETSEVNVVLKKLNWLKDW